MNGLSEHDVMLRKTHFNMTDAQARRLPGWHKAKHRGDNGEWYLLEEHRDATGQLIEMRPIKRG